MNSFWNKISFFGLEHLDQDDAVFNYRENILINRISFLMFAVLILYLPVEVIFNGWELVGFIVAEGLLMLGTMVLNKKGYFNAAKYYMLFICLFMIGPMILAVPKGAGNEYFMVPASMAGVLFLKEKWKAFAFMLLALIMFYVFTNLRGSIAPFAVVPPEKLAFFGKIFIAMIFLMAFIIVIYFRISGEDYEKIIHEQRDKLQSSNELISEKNKEIIDSITYAKRIQTAILPPDKFISENLPNAFVYYQPKDIIAGDFYWMERVAPAGIKEEGKVLPLEEDLGGVVLFAAADCTGHGVPGALVSVVCNNALNRTVREYGITDPAGILEKTREIVVQEFEKSEEDVKDGMDISLCSLQKIEMDGNLKTTLKWAGANNSLWVLRKGATEFEETKPDKQPIGKCSDPKPFTTHVIELNEGDTFYIFTDGFQDQFGGEKGKKFKASQLKSLLLGNQSLSMQAQKDVLHATFQDWRIGVEQVDDVCVIGVRM